MRVGHFFSLEVDDVTFFWNASHTGFMGSFGTTTPERKGLDCFNEIYSDFTGLPLILKQFVSRD